LYWSRTFHIAEADKSGKLALADIVRPESLQWFFELFH